MTGSRLCLLQIGLVWLMICIIVCSTVIGGIQRLPGKGTHRTLPGRLNIVFSSQGFYEETEYVRYIPLICMCHL